MCYLQSYFIVAAKRVTAMTLQLPAFQEHAHKHGRLCGRDIQQNEVAAGHAEKYGGIHPVLGLRKTAVQMGSAENETANRRRR